MKKGLLLSLAASAVIFAGGDIAPVEPAAPASADFWGQIGIRYQAQDFDNANLDFGDEQNNNFDASVVLGVEKQLGYGFGFGAEVAGWSDFGFDIADNAAVASFDATSAEVSQAYLTYTFGNTAIKAGRQALPKAVSPWAWSDRSVGVIDSSFDAIVVANTDLQDTTLVGAWVLNLVPNNSPIHLDAVGTNTGLFMLAAINKSLPNTTLSVSAYYAPDFVLGGADDTWSIWGAATGNVDSIKWGLQAVAVDGNAAGWDSTYAVAGKLGTGFGDLDVGVVAAYINDGDFTLNAGGTSGFWGNSLGGFLSGSGTAVGADQTIIRGLAGYKIGTGKLYGELVYDNYGSGFDHAWGARLGYKFKLMNSIDANVEYRYADYTNSPVAGSDTRQRIRVEAYYKF